MIKFQRTSIYGVIIILFLLHIGVAHGQATSGYIRYEEKIDQHKLLPPQMEAMKNNIDQYSSGIYRFYFNPTESIYKAYFEDRPVPQQGFGGPGMRMTISSININNHFYTNSEMMITQAVFLDQTYFMSDTIEMAQWKFGEGTRTILGYTCNLAYYTDNTNPEKPLEVTAWYTPKIRAFVGPERYNTLPGGILALDINGGDHYWVARKIELRDLTAEEKIEVPVEKKNAKKVTYKQYLKAQDDRMKEMRARFGGGR
jgi:GLPGLI family protein